MMIRLIQMLCPARHCLCALIYEAEKHSPEEAERQMREQYKAIGGMEYCGICGSADITLDNQPSKYTVWKEAEADIHAQMISNALTRMLIEAAKKQRADAERHSRN